MPFETGDTQEKHGIQMLRAIAASAVVLHHALEESNATSTAFSPDWLTVSGAAGVDVFFVISGFIILYTSFRPMRLPITPSAFLLRRVTRIYPIYWTCCLGLLALMAIGFLRNHRLTPGEISLSLLLLPSPKLIIFVSWTLVYEIYFYALFSLTLLSRSIYSSAIISTMLIALLWMSGNLLESGTLKTFLSNPIPFEFVAGLWIAVVYKRVLEAGKIWRVSPAWSVLGFVMLAAAPLYVFHASTAGLQSWSRVLAWGFPASLIVAAFLSIDSSKALIVRLMVLLGDASYALYLTHAFVMIGYGYMIKNNTFGAVPQIVVVPLVLIVAIIVGVVTHLTVERPFYHFVRRWTNRMIDNSKNLALSARMRLNA